MSGGRVLLKVAIREEAMLIENDMMDSMNEGDVGGSMKYNVCCGNEDDVAEDTCRDVVGTRLSSEFSCMGPREHHLPLALHFHLLPSLLGHAGLLAEGTNLANEDLDLLITLHADVLLHFVKGHATQQQLELDLKVDALSHQDSVVHLVQGCCVLGGGQQLQY
jgi:hypothetical protein